MVKSTYDQKQDGGWRSRAIENSQTRKRGRPNCEDQRSRPERQVMYQQQKRYNTALDRFSDFKLAWHPN